MLTSQAFLGNVHECASSSVGDLSGASLETFKKVKGLYSIKKSSPPFLPAIHSFNIYKSLQHLQHVI